MDYEKKYKQLHTLISDLYPFMSEFCKEKVEGFLPELKESEDERIRKLLISGMKNLNYNVETFASIPIKDVIAWLEKQGEVVSDKDDIEAEEKGIRKAFDKIWEEKQDKQKSQRMISAEAKEAMYDKPAEWSEEEEVKINRIVACLENLNVADNDILLKDVDWLKSLKTRYTWKPSDEQLEIIDMLLTNETMDDNIARILRELREQLKKLREDKL